MAVDAEMRDAIERARGGLETMTVAECLRTADVIRDSTKRLSTPRKREIAEEAARRFEQRAAALATFHGPL